MQCASHLYLIADDVHLVHPAPVVDELLDVVSLWRVDAWMRRWIGQTMPVTE